MPAANLPIDLWHWEYSVGSGIWQHRLPDGVGWEMIVKCYSGRDEGLNNTGMERVPNTGPIPRAFYRVSGMRTKPGRIAMMPLLPLRDQPGYSETIDGMPLIYGRSAFEFHGDNFHGNFSASSGCIVSYQVVTGKFSTPLGAREYVGNWVDQGHIYLRVTD